MNVYRITLISIFATLSVIGRYAFAFLPNVQPVTSIIIISGFFLGPISAILLAIVVTFLSNMLLGMGIWTIWQIVAWGIIGFISGLIGKFCKKIPIYVVLFYAIFSGYFYGFIVSLTTYQVTGSFWPYYILGLPMDTYHAIGNGFFILFLYPLVSFLMKKYINDHFTVQNTTKH